MTGSSASASTPLGLNTFSVRQSSELAPDGELYADITDQPYAQATDFINTLTCAHAGPNCVASSVVALIVSKSTGGTKREVPIGGLAYGMPITRCEL